MIGKRANVTTYACMNGLILPGRQVFLVDTHVNADPSYAQLCEITVMAAEEMKRLGIIPKAALLSHLELRARAARPRRRRCVTRSRCCAREGALARGRWRDAWRRGTRPRVPGAHHAAQHADGARPTSWSLPNIDAANISYNLLKTAAGGGIAIGPVLLGAARPVHVLDALDDRAPHRQHDRAHGRRRQRGALKPIGRNVRIARFAGDRRGRPSSKRAAEGPTASGTRRFRRPVRAMYEHLVVVANVLCKLEKSGHKPLDNEAKPGLRKSGGAFEIACFLARQRSLH